MNVKFVCKPPDVCFDMSHDFMDISISHNRTFTIAVPLFSFLSSEEIKEEFKVRSNEIFGVGISI
jgi:hypothetical protein